MIAGHVGSGDARKRILGAEYDAVQAIVNQRLGSATATATNQVLAKQVLTGKLGTGDTRKHLLGSYYNAVQAVINKTAAPAAKIGKGSTVTVTKAIDEHGTKLAISGTYTVMSLSGSRAVIGRGGVVTAAMNVANLRLA